MLGLIGLNEMVLTEALVTCSALRQRVNKGLEMTRCLPDLRCQNDGGVKADNVIP